MERAHLCVGIDHVHVKACLCDRVEGHWRLISWLDERPFGAEQAGLQIEVGPRTLTPMVNWVAETLGHLLSCDLTDARPPAAASAGGARDAAYGIHPILLTAAPQPPLRVWLMALTSLWMSPLEALIQSLEAHVVGSLVMDQGIYADLLARDLELIRPDLLVIGGGYDALGASESPLIGFARHLGTCLPALGAGAPAILFAGSSHAATPFVRILRRMAPQVDITLVDNPTPEPQRVHLQPLHDALLEFRMRSTADALSLDEISKWTRNGRAPQSHGANFLRVLQALQRGLELSGPVHAILGSGGNRLHVLLPPEGNRNPLTAYTAGAHMPDYVKTWPDPTLVSGLPAHEVPAASGLMNDGHGFLPLLAPLLEVDAEAAWSVITRDLIQLPQDA